MEFYTQNRRTRPVRLCEETRRFALDSLNRRYGLDTLTVSTVSSEGIADFESLSDLKKYDLAIRRIAEEAPIRLCEGERLSGAATLGEAIRHNVPFTHKGEVVFPGVSHLTADFGKVLRVGVKGIRREAEEALRRYEGTEKEAFFRSCLACLDAFGVWHGRYLTALKDLPAYRDNYENLLRVPMEPAETFYQAVQSLWFTFAFLRLCGCWPGIGRLDVLLGGFLKEDLRAGRLTLEEAREVLAHLFIKGCEWINGQYVGSGDAQHYQNIVLSGTDEEGREVTNEVTYLVLDILEELGISDFPTSVRLHRNTEERLLRRVAEVMRYGGGTLAVYNEETVIQALVADGYGEREARTFANDGCWEVQIPGKTFFIYSSFDALQILQRETLRCYDGSAAFPDFASLYEAYRTDLERAVEGLTEELSGIFLPKEGENAPWRWRPTIPCTLISLFEEGCIEKGLSYWEGGPKYNLHSPHIGGMADAVNSLYAIRRLVYEEKRCSLTELTDILARNWEGEEPLRQYVLNRYPCYGNDNEEADGLAARLLSDFAAICQRQNGRCGYRLPAGVSTFGRQLSWAPCRLASPHGKKAGEILAANCSPTPASDREGATAMIRSYCAIDHTKLAGGSALDVKLLPSSVEGEDGLAALTALMRGFVLLGGFFMQPDVVDASLLREAQEHPEDYPTLSVRVSGWNARFVTLDREWQNMVIEQNEH